jgi:phosphate transport system substrate-binding protein
VSRTRFCAITAACALLAAAAAGPAAARPAPTSGQLAGETTSAGAVGKTRAAPANAAGGRPTITMSGSTSVHPLAVALARGYLKKFRNAARFRILQGGSDTGISDVARGRVSIGNSSRDLQAGDPGGLQFTKIARDGVCVVTHPDNALSSLSQEQVQSIFSGQVRRWEDVPAAGVEGPINLYVRTQASGTQDAFQNIFMGPNLRVASSASQKASNGLVQSSLRSDESGIGYVDFRFTAGTHVIPYQGVPCTLRNAKSGQYPGIRNFWFVTRGAPRGATRRFINWSRKRSTQRKIVARSWVPYK